MPESSEKLEHFRLDFIRRLEDGEQTALRGTKKRKNHLPAFRSEQATTQGETLVNARPHASSTYTLSSIPTLPTSPETRPLQVT